MNATSSGRGSDVSVQGTNDDAQISKLCVTVRMSATYMRRYPCHPFLIEHGIRRSCVKLGYFKDDFVHYFVRRSASKRSPLINRGLLPTQCPWLTAYLPTEVALRRTKEDCFT